ncbi:MAG: hypothetical protein GTO63_07145, partial [Anaerolineae bacterium]|nr:hypothetical protein [Anaerolineae bacterium]NIN94704.1 hypothetical protein [Anaerolineae bacterium]NIQ77770.1 hypothetical protein [Anaerolineae bacterium]
MAQVDKIAREVRLKFERPRRLELPAQGSPPSQPVENDVPKITELRDNFLKVANKARRILDASSELAVLRRVPVPLDAKELRAAVVRQDEDSQGLFITYDLYRRALAYLRNRSSAVPLAVFDEFTGDPVLDHRRAGQRLRTLVDGIDADTAELIASQITVLFISKLLQMGLDNLDSGKQTATKQPSSAELPVIAASLAISLAAQLLYAGLTEAEIEASLEELGGAMPSNLNMDAAKQSLRDSSIFQAGLLGKRPGDYELIVDFVRVFLFLNKQTDPGWDTWQLADDLEGAEALARSSADSLSKYNDVTPPGEPPKTVEVDEGILSSEGALVR